MSSPRSIEDHFITQPIDYWQQAAFGGGKIEHGDSTIRFTIERANPSSLSDAEIGDYHSGMTWRPSLSMQVRAHFSHQAEGLLGTAGFGFWNNPFRRGWTIASPNALWFFFASPPSQMGFGEGSADHGWKAYALNTGNPPSWLVAVGGLALKLPFVRKLAWRTAASQIKLREKLLEMDMTHWHDYRLDWRSQEAKFFIDGLEILRVLNPPPGPLGFVAWMDNQFAVVKPDARAKFGTLPISRRQWLEIDSMKIEAL